MFDAEAFLVVKKQFEEGLRGLISKAVDDFRNQTGFSPSAINCHLIEVTGFEDRGRQFMVGGVETQYELFGDKVQIR